MHIFKLCDPTPIVNHLCYFINFQYFYFFVFLHFVIPPSLSLLYEYIIIPVSLPFSILYSYYIYILILISLSYHPLPLSVRECAVEMTVNVAKSMKPDDIQNHLLTLILFYSHHSDEDRRYICMCMFVFICVYLYDRVGR